MLPHRVSPDALTRSRFKKQLDNTIAVGCFFMNVAEHGEGREDKYFLYQLSGRALGHSLSQRLVRVCLSADLPVAEARGLPSS